MSLSSSVAIGASLSFFAKGLLFRVMPADSQNQSGYATRIDVVVEFVGIVTSCGVCVIAVRHRWACIGRWPAMS